MLDKNTQAFTLIELLLVIGIVAILAAGAIVVLDPVEQLNKARDGTRLSDIQSINRALSIYELNGGQTFGSANTVYISIPDSSATCANLTLPSLPSGWTYACVTSDNSQKVDGTGWIPVPFNTVSQGSPLAKIPIDPINSDTDGAYYTYISGGSWVVTALLQSEKELKSVGIEDGGTDSGRYELGSDLDLWRQASGLIGYWKFDESSGSTAQDFSGEGNDGTLTNSPVWTSDCKVRSCLDFSPTNKWVTRSSVSNLPDSEISVLGWVNMNSFANWHRVVHHEWVSNGWLLFTDVNGDAIFGIGQSGVQHNSRMSSGLSLNTWHLISGIYDGSTVKIYVDGEEGNITDSLVGGTIDNTDYVEIGKNMDGMIDEVRIYNRALTAEEVNAIYKAEK